MTRGPKDQETGNRPNRAIGSWSLGLLVLWSFGLLPSATADDWAPNATLSAVWNSNATNANLDSDQIDTLQFKADILASQRYGLGQDDSFHLSGHAAGEWWPRYDGLLGGAIGARLEWRHKFGLGALAPVISIEAAADGTMAREDGRSGASTGVTLSFRKRLNNTTRLTVSHEIARQDARQPAFDREGNESSIELDRDLSDVTRLTFTLRHRNGDVLSYATPPRPDLVALAPNRVLVETWGRPMVAYSIDARTWSARAALTRAVDETTAIVAAYEWRTSKRKTLSYVNHLVSVALVHQF